MGATHVTVAVSNPGDPQRRWESLFLVDTEATDCMVPGKRLRSIGITPRWQRKCKLTDGSEIRLDAATAEVELMGEIVGTTVLFGADGTCPVLGLAALQSAGIGVDAETQLLQRPPAVRLKSLRDQVPLRGDR